MTAYTTYISENYPFYAFSYAYTGAGQTGEATSTYVHGPNTYITADGDYTVDLWLGSQSPVTNFCTFTVKNVGTVAKTYQLINSVSGEPVHNGNQSCMDLQPGETGTIRLGTTNSCANYTLLGYVGKVTHSLDPDGSYLAWPWADTITEATNPSVGTSTSDWVTNSPSTLAGATTSVYNNPASWGSNSPISFTTNSVAGDNINTLQTGFSALYSAVAEGNKANDANLKGIAETLRGMSNNAANSGTTNGGYSDSGSWTNLASKFSNADDAKAFGESQLSGPLGTIDSMSGSVGDTGFSESGGEAIDITIGSTMVVWPSGVPKFHITPESNNLLAGLWPLAKRLWTWLLWAGYALKIVKDLQAAWDRLISTRGMNVQQLNFTFLGTGGNAAGAALVAVAVLAAFALYAAALAGLFTSLTGSAFTWSTVTGALHDDPLGGINTGAKHLLLATFPVALALSLVMAYITWKLTLLKIGVIYQAACKAILGS